MIRQPASILTISSIELKSRPKSNSRSDDIQLFEPLIYPPSPTPIRNNLWQSRPASAGLIYPAHSANICPPIYSGSAPLSSAHISHETSPRARTTVRHHRLIRAFMAFAERWRR